MNPGTKLSMVSRAAALGFERQAFVVTPHAAAGR